MSLRNLIEIYHNNFIMIKLSKELYDQSVERKGDLLVINFKVKQLISLNTLQELTRVDKIRELYAQQNNLRQMESFLESGVALKVLDLSFNYIKTIENHENLMQLEVLNLSTNKLTQVQDLSVLRSLRKLDLTMNYIDDIADMNLPNLDTLKLVGNQLTYIPSLKGLPRLREFDVSRNKITSVTRIASEGGLQYLEKLKASFNLISEEYLEEFCLVLQSLPNLLEIDFKGTNMSLAKNYELSVLKAKKLRILDNKVISDAVIQNMINLNKNQQYEQLIEGTKEEYLKWMEERERVRKEIKKTMLNQMLRVDELFEDKREATIKEMNEYLEFVKELDRRKMKGENVDISAKTFQEWKRGIQESEQLRIHNLKVVRQQQKLNEQYLLNNQIGNRNILQKLYDIALNEPDMWREIKRKEIGYQQIDQQTKNEEREDEIEKILRQDQAENFNQVAAQMRKGARQNTNMSMRSVDRSVNQSQMSRRSKK